MGKRLTACFLLAAALLPHSPAAQAESETESYIKYMEFGPCYSALEKALAYDLESYGTAVHVNWIQLLAILACRYGGDFSKYRGADLDELAEAVLSGACPDSIAAEYTYYDYYFTAYSAVLGEFVGVHRMEVPHPEMPGRTIWEDRYGLKVFSPIAADFAFTHYDDFGASRTYGYSRRHLGHDMFGAVGTPIVAVESGTITVLGWNQYGGWRIGIRSFDGLRYYYYAHLRQTRPYHCALKEGQVVRAGDVIGYMGRTGYSAREGTNGISDTHLHWGLQLIFHPDQEEGVNEIWVDLYAITRLLERNRSKTHRVAETKEFYRSYAFDEPNLSGTMQM